MVTAWCLVKKKHLASAFSGEGAAKYPARWNSRGVPIVYTSSTRALAALETLVHLNPPVYFEFSIIPLEFRQNLVGRLALADLPSDWGVQPPPPSTQIIGDEWFISRRSAVLAVPSCIVPQEVNYLINPLHPDFQKISMGSREDFRFDPRLLD